MIHRSARLLAILAGAFVATPLVVMAAGGPGPGAVAAPAAVLAAPVAVVPPAAVVAAVPAVRAPEACGRRVRVVYPGYQPPADAACAVVTR